MTARSRSRSGSSSTPWLAGVLAVVVLCGATALPSASYATGGVDRGTSARVADDVDAALGLDVADNVTVGTTELLVVVTNGLGEDATVTVALRDDSTSKGDLSTASASGDEVSFALAAGESQSVDAVVANESTYVGDELGFHVTVDGVDVDATVRDRTATITDTA